MGGGVDLRLAELQHRVLGNFELLHALIAIRLRSVSDPESRRHLAWLNDIVAALGLLNRRLAEGRMDDFGRYLEEVAGFWRRVCVGRNLEIAVEAESVRLDETMATSLAIVAHELLAAAVARSLPGAEHGRITLGLTAARGRVVLSVADAGAGASASAGEGLTLVCGLAEHLGGTVRVEDGDEPRVTVEAPLGRRTPPRPH